jgi:hypothetical protein
VFLVPLHVCLGSSVLASGLVLARSAMAPGIAWYCLCWCIRNGPSRAACLRGAGGVGASGAQVLARPWPGLAEAGLLAGQLQLAPGPASAPGP